MIYVYRTQFNGQTEFFTRKRDAIRAARAELKRTGTSLTYVYASAFRSHAPDAPEMFEHRRKIEVARNCEQTRRESQAHEFMRETKLIGYLG